MQYALAVFAQDTARREWPALFEGCNAVKTQQGRTRRAVVEDRSNRSCGQLSFITQNTVWINDRCALTFHAGMGTESGYQLRLLYTRCSASLTTG